jgi:hypothetical protein
MNNERKPLLTHKGIEDVISEAGDVFDWSNDGQWQLVGGTAVRDHYERLITEGKLRAVEEVTVDDDGNCSGCGKWVGYPNDPLAAWSGELPKHCKNCGQPIKR